MKKELHLLEFLLLSLFVVFGCAPQDMTEEKVTSPVVEDVRQDAATEPEPVQEPQSAEDVKTN